MIVSYRNMSLQRLSANVWNTVGSQMISGDGNEADRHTKRTP